MDGIAEPVPAAVHRALRRAVLDQKSAERRRTFPLRVHAGVPGSETVCVAPGGPLDHALRTDVVAALVRRTHRDGCAPMVWLTRPGDLELQDADVAWLAAALAAHDEAGLGLTFVVVTRHGWRDPRSGAGRTWRRLRERSAAGRG